MWKCRLCGNETILSVAVSDGVQFYSCMHEDCEWHAQLLIMMDEGIFVSQTKLVETYTKLWEEGKDEQDNIQESED